VAAQSKVRTALNRSDADLNPARGTGKCLGFLFVSFVGTGLTKGLSPIQGYLPNAYKGLLFQDSFRIRTGQRTSSVTGEVEGKSKWEYVQF
jgi:hypothetical protein